MISAPANLLVIAATCLVSWFGFRSEAFERKYIFDPEAILAGKEYYRLVTSSFLHANWYHLILNMVSLYLFGTTLELVFGPGHFLLIYFGAIIGGDLLSLYVHRHHEYRAYGASGGVCGILFAYILLFPGARIAQLPLPIPIPGWLYVILFMAGSFVGMKGHNRGNIGHDAHLGGAIVGLLIAAALYPGLARANSKIFLIVLTAAIALLVYLWFNPLFLPMISFLGRGVRKRQPPAKLPAYKRQTLEMDAVLEKINQQGLESLSEKEKELLAEVSAKFQRRAESKKPESGLAI